MGIARMHFKNCPVKHCRCQQMPHSAASESQRMLLCLCAPPQGRNLATDATVQPSMEQMLQPWQKQGTGTSAAFANAGRIFMVVKSTSAHSVVAVYVCTGGWHISACHCQRHDGEGNAVSALLLYWSCCLSCILFVLYCSSWLLGCIQPP